jgi:hypothetical protein
MAEVTPYKAHGEVLMMLRMFLKNLVAEVSMMVENSPGLS